MSGNLDKRVLEVLLEDVDVRRSGSNHNFNLLVVDLEAVEDLLGEVFKELERSIALPVSSYDKLSHTSK